GRRRDVSGVFATAWQSGIGETAAGLARNTRLAAIPWRNIAWLRPGSPGHPQHGRAVASGFVFRRSLVSCAAGVLLGVPQFWGKTRNAEPGRGDAGHGLLARWLRCAIASGRRRCAAGLRACVYEDIWGRNGTGNRRRHCYLADWFRGVLFCGCAVADSRRVVARKIARTCTGKRPGGRSSPTRRPSLVKCPFCAHLDDKVIDSREGRGGDTIRRRRECLKCSRRFTTYERIDEIPYMVIKKDGRRERFERQKILQGDRKSTRLNSSHLVISYAVFCLKKKKKKKTI